MTDTPKWHERRDALHAHQKEHRPDEPHRVDPAFGLIFACTMALTLPTPLYLQLWKTVREGALAIHDDDAPLLGFSFYLEELEKWPLRSGTPPDYGWVLLRMGELLQDFGFEVKRPADMPAALQAAAAAGYGHAPGLLDSLIWLDDHTPEELYKSALPIVTSEET